MNWYYDIEGRSQGPLSETSLKRLAREGAISAGTLVWHPGLEEWDSLAKLNPEIAEHVNKGAAVPQAGGKTGSIPLPEQAGQEGSGAFKRLFGWGKK